MQIVNCVDDNYETRLSTGSVSCLFPSLICMDIQPRNSVSYNKLPQNPLVLTVLKLDGSSFGIEVEKTGTVAEVKRAVEAVFRHLPKKGPGKISWAHVWGQFCLCHEGQKLLNDSDYIGIFGIRDGDQLQFIHQLPSSYNLARIQSEKYSHDSVDEHKGSSHNYAKQTSNERNDSHHIDIVEDSQDDDMEIGITDISKYEYRIRHLLNRWFTYHKLTSFQPYKT